MKASEMWNASDPSTRLRWMLPAFSKHPGPWRAYTLTLRALITWHELTTDQQRAIVEEMRALPRFGQQLPLYPIEADCG